MPMLPPIIILHQTQLGQNIGMCARAMLNCGLEQLRLIAPRDGWPNPAAIATAADADIVLEKTQCFATLEEAISDCHHLYATTARPRHQAIPVLPVAEAVVQIRDRSTSLASPTNSTSSPQQSAILFGPEASGLDNNALSHADTLIHFPTNPEFSSLNLAQAVLLFGWEWRRSEAQNNAHTTPSTSAQKKELHNFLKRLENELEQAEFFLTPELRPETLRKLRSLFTRTQLSEQELNMLHGVITALKK